MNRTRIKLDVTIEHDGDSLYPVFSPLDFVEHGLAAAMKAEIRHRPKTWRAPKLLAILPGARLDLRIPRKRTETLAVISRMRHKPR